MSLFSFLRFRRAKARPVGTTLEKGSDQDDRRTTRNQILAKSAILLALFAIALAVFPRGDFYKYTIDVNDTWRNETLVAPFSFVIYKTEEELAREEAEVKQSTPPTFNRTPDHASDLLANRDTVATQVENVLETAAQMALNRSRGRLDEAEQDSLDLMQQKSWARPSLSSAQWDRLITDYLARVPELPRNSRDLPSGPPLYEQLLGTVVETAMDLLERGVLSIPIDSVYADSIFVLDPSNNSFTPVPTERVVGINDAYNFARSTFRQVFSDNPIDALIAEALFRAIMQPNYTYDAENTRAEWEARIAQISKSRGGVTAGQTIVKRDEVIDEGIHRRLLSLQKTTMQTGSRQQYARQLAGQALLVFCTLLMFFLYLFLLRRSIFNNNAHVLLIAILFVLVLGQFGFGIRSEFIGLYAVPVSIAAILLTIIFDSRVGLFGVLTLGFLGSHISGFDLEFAFATVFTGSLVIFSVRDIKNRAQFFISAGLVLVGYFAILLGAWLLQTMSTERLIADSLNISAHATLTLLAYPLLWVFERIFNITTDVTLLELSDTNRPILKEMSMKASGTFNHSLQVANLAEAAADAIGANALLTRVGALYHDIGKMSKPEYFVENQRGYNNPHDQLKPSMSALIIASHVKEGVEMAREVRLPKPVLDFIPMHHGTTRIEYFYRKAKEQHNAGDPPILDANFRYPGPRPQSKETGILMLSDGVEAAARALDNPTHKRLENLIDGIVQARIDDGQLDDTDLTFSDLRRIKETFLSMLLGIYHVRIKYPGSEKTDDEQAASGEGSTGQEKAASESTKADAKATKPDQEKSKGASGQGASGQGASGQGASGQGASEKSASEKQETGEVSDDNASESSNELATEPPVTGASPVTAITGDGASSDAAPEQQTASGEGASRDESKGASDSA